MQKLHYQLRNKSDHLEIFGRFTNGALDFIKKQEDRWNDYATDHQKNNQHLFIDKLKANKEYLLFLRTHACPT